MTIAGVYCRSHPDGSLSAAIAILRESTLARLVDHHGDWTASELATLSVGAELVFAEWQPERVVIWQLGPVVSGIPGGIRVAAAGIRAEGVIGSVAARAGARVETIERDRVLAAGGERRIAQAVAELARPFAPLPETESGARAVAAGAAGLAPVRDDGP